MTPPERYLWKTPSIATRTEAQISPLQPEGPVLIEDIVHSTAMKVRYTGHVRRFYSVAQHQVLVSEAVERAVPDAPIVWLQGLFHDASEAYLPDIASPLKSSFYVRQGDLNPRFEKFREMEHRLLAHIFEALGLPWPLPEVVGAADRAIFLTERRDRVIHPPSWWEEASLVQEQLDGIAPVERIRPQDIPEAFLGFLQRFEECLVALEWELPPKLADYFFNYAAAPVSAADAFFQWRRRAVDLHLEGLIE